MALIKCPDCGSDVSDLATVCPKCARPIASSYSERSEREGSTRCIYCGEYVNPVVTSVGGGSCSFGSRERWRCPSCERVILKKGCFVATATYGDEDYVEVQFLRAFRDSIMQASAIGRCLIWLYYNVAPYPAVFVERFPFLQRMMRKCLDVIVVIIERVTSLRRSNFRAQ